MAKQARDASYLWIDAGSMSKSSRHRLALPRAVAEFFEDPSAKETPVSLLIKPRQGSPVACALTHDTATAESGANDVWHLNLPNARQGGFSYVGQVIRFRKTIVDEQAIFELEIELPGSETADLWHRIAEARGDVGTTDDIKRRFGYW